MTEPTKKTRRSPAQKTRPAVDRTALADKLNAAITIMRDQLRKSETLVLPGLMQRMLPTDAGKGDRALVIDWRAWVVFAEWTGAEWDLVIIQDGKEQKRSI